MIIIRRVWFLSSLIVSLSLIRINLQLHLSNRIISSFQSSVNRFPADQFATQGVD